MSLKEYLYYQDEWATIYCGDCLEIMPLLGGIDLVIADPQYSTPVMTSFGRETIKNYGDLSIQKCFFTNLKKEIFRILRQEGAILIHCDDSFSGILFSIFYDWHKCQYLIWDKTQIGMGSPFRRQHEFMVFASRNRNFKFYDDNTRATILKCAPIPSEKRHHGAEKPLSLVTDLVLALCNKEATLLDPFLGSGTTCVAAKNLNRKSIGIEINPDYCEIAVKRLRQEVFDFSGGKG
jgi:site-specific DNA-methyltransferase (adenine-specific)